MLLLLMMFQEDGCAAVTAGTFVLFSVTFFCFSCFMSLTNLMLPQKDTKTVP